MRSASWTLCFGLWQLFWALLYESGLLSALTYTDARILNSVLA